MNDIKDLAVSTRNAEQNLRQLKEAQKAEKAEVLKKLILLKFGPERGSLVAACGATGIAPGNLSAMLRQRVTIPTKYLDALAALPDYVPPKHEPVPSMAGWDLRITLSIKAHELLRDICNAHDKNFCAPNTPQVYEMVLEQIIKDTHVRYLADGYLDFKYKKVAAPSLDDILS